LKAPGLPRRTGVGATPHPLGAPIFIPLFGLLSFLRKTPHGADRTNFGIAKEHYRKYAEWLSKTELLFAF